ncbi:MAG TPA: alpha/beta fold hydrolase [Solirubrobacteraceae bacterium]|jgi:pimeloyl-ACP methyl ester carboxylesterase|nr:alpha/beta fold hydrolase [Solirubrobacteraceae bacterium]
MTSAEIELPHVDGMTHRMVDVDGLNMHVAEAGSGPPVLMLHGWPQHWYAWRGVAPRLAVERRVICPDLRGFGWSDAPPGAYDKATLARDVMGLLDALELDRVELVAHDWGAWIGFMLCLEHPERFAHYLALNIYTPWPEPPSPRAIPVLARLWYQVALATPIFGEALIRHTSFVSRLIKAGAVHPAWSDEDIRAFTAPLRARARADASVHLYRTFLLRELPRFLGGQFRDQRLTVPTLLLHGTRDLAIDHRALGQWQSHADEMDVELREDSGHFIAEELPELVATRARELFDGSRRGETRPVS